MKKFFPLFDIKNKKIITSLNLLKKINLLLALSATMILSFYISTSSLFQFNLGLLLLKVCVITYSSSIICAFGFSKILEDI